MRHWQEWVQAATRSSHVPPRSSIQEMCLFSSITNINLSSNRRRNNNRIINLGAE